MDPGPEQHQQYRYHHCGLTLEVNEPLSRLAQASHDSRVDVRVVMVEPGAVVAGERSWRRVSPYVSRADAPDGSWLRVRYSYERSWAEFVIDGRGESVWVSRSPDVAMTDATELLLGPMFSCLAAQRGMTCIHAAVVRVEDRVIAVAGHSGAGKSTTALALVQSGEGLLVSDDVAVLSEHDGVVTVSPGAPRIRMREEPAMSLLGQFDSLESVWSEGHPSEPKRYVEIDPGRAATAAGARLELSALYLLGPWSDRVSEPSIRALAPGEALPRLMTLRHVIEALPSSSNRRDFERLALLLRSAAARELTRPSGLESTEASVAAILSDVRALA